MEFHQTTYTTAAATSDSFSFSAEPQQQQQYGQQDAGPRPPSGYPPGYAPPPAGNYSQQPPPPQQPPPQAQYPPMQQPQTQPPQQQQQYGMDYSSYGGDSAYQTHPPPPPLQQQQQPQYQQQTNYGGYGQQQAQGGDTTWGTDDFTKAISSHIATGMAANAMGSLIGPHVPFTTPSANQFKQDLTTWWGFFKMYFRVTNRYVLNRLKVISFPFRTDHTRLSSEEGSAQYPYADASQDNNAMDLYLPSIALVTYVLLSAAIMGANKNFKPEVLGSQTSWCIAVCLLEVCVLQGLAMSFGVTSKLWLIDSVCMSGYKFVGVCLCLLFRCLLPSPFWMVPLGWCCACSGFLLRAQLREHFKSGPHVVTRAHPVLLAVAAWQPCIYLFLVANVVGE